MAYGMQPQRDPTAVMGRRIVAYIIDALLIGGTLVAALLVIKHQTFKGAPVDACRTLREGGFNGQCVQFGSRVYTWRGGAMAAGYGISALVGLLDLVVLQGVTGASVGKHILGLRVVNAQGQPCGLGRAFVRWLLLIVDASCFIVGLLVALLTHPHRRIGDMAAGTYVVALADVGRPFQGAPAAYQYGYPPSGPPGWAPPGVAQPPAAPWGTPPPSAWGAPPPPPAAPWGAPPPATPPTWGATPPPESAPPGWGTPPTPPTGPAPDPGTQPWAAPAPAPTPPPPAPAPTPPPPAAPSPPAPAPAPAAEPEPTPAAEGESWWSKAFSEDEGDETEK